MKIIAILLILFSLLKAEQKYKIFYVNSYHTGYSWSDSLEAEFCKRMNVNYRVGDLLAENDSVKIKFFRMDTKRNNDKKYIKKIAKITYKNYLNFKPDIVVATDDNANEFFVAPYLKDKNMRVVFCGVSKDLKKYGYPTNYIVGVLERNNFLIVPKIFNDTQFVNKKIAFLGANDSSSKYSYMQLKKDLNMVEVDFLVATSMRDWINYYLDSQKKYDYLFLQLVTGSSWWNAKKINVTKFDIKIPVITFYKKMLNYSAVCLETSPNNQSEYVVYIVKQILMNNKKISEFGVVDNIEPEIYVNTSVIEKAKLKINTFYLFNSKIYNSEGIK